MSKALHKALSLNLHQNLTVTKNLYGVGEIAILGDIVDEAFWNEDVSPRSIMNALNEIGNVSQLDLFINSYGGSISAGNAIYNILADYRRKTNCKITAYISFAASMGTGIAMVADEIVFYENSQFMIHRAMGVAYGNLEDFDAARRRLELAENTLVSNYMKKFTGTGAYEDAEEELRAMLSAETWFGHKEATECGFCNRVIEEVPIVASANLESVTLNGVLFKNKALIDKILAKVPNITIQNGGEHMNYDEMLNEYGITEEQWSAMTANDLIEKVTAQFANFVDRTELENVTAKFEGFISPTELAENYTKNDEIPHLDNSLAEKATQFDAVVALKVEETLKNGIKADGPEKFNSELYTKLMTNMSYKEICELNDTFIERAKTALNAGHRASAPKSSYTGTKKNTKEPEINY